MGATSLAEHVTVHTQQPHHTSMVKRWDKKTLKMVEVIMPDIVSIFNKSMAGGDLVDSPIALCRTKVRSKKQIFFHMMDMVLVEACLLYRKGSTNCGVEQRKQLSLMDFKS